MNSPFAIKNSANNQLRYTTFDWTHSNNLTFGIGKLIPTMCELLPAGSSVKFTATAGFQFMPMVFPNQTTMYLRQSFFKVPLRTLWKDYMDFVGNFRDGLVEPYHDFAGNCPRTGSLFDYLGLPTTLVGSYGTSVEIPFPSQFLYGIHDTVGAKTAATSPADYYQPGKTLSELFVGDLECLTASATSETVVLCKVVGFDYNNIDFTKPFIPRGQAFNKLGSSLYYIFTNDAGVILGGASYNWSDDSFTVSIPEGSVPTQIWVSVPIPSYNSCPPTVLSEVFNWSYSKPLMVATLKNTDWRLECTGFTSSGSARDITPDSSPYYDSTSKNKDKQLKISAYGARAYESVYNSHFRDNRNRPLYINGQIEYNKWIPTNEGGADAYPYSLHSVNWEKDVFTTAVQSPQQGIAPLVGITTYQDSEVLDDGVTRTTSRVALVDEDGRKFGLSFESNKDGLLDVKYSELSPDTPVSKSRSLIDLASSGISISDFRNVNAYQKFLELNMRQGYSYRDIIQGRFEVKVRYDELMIPEFLGGFSDIVDMKAIIQTVQRADTGSYADQLGAMGGNAGIRKQSRRISCFADEECILLGVAYVIPVPIYTQVLPKHFLYRGLLDHFQPEFANIGFQPITYRELCPIQAYNDNPDSLYDTFGYNRPWSEYVQKLDTAHGLFRTSLKNFIMNRTFNIKPELSDSFLLVDEEQINDVFAVNDVSDKIFGQIRFDMSGKMPLSRSWRPSLG